MASNSAATPRSRDAHILTLDIGSSSVRASIVGSDALVLRGCDFKEPHEMRYTPDGGAELDPEELLGRAVHVIDLAVSAARSNGVTIDAVFTDTIWHSVCGVDDNAKATFPILTWAERRPAAAAATLRTKIDDLAQHRRTGARLHSMYLPAKLLWVSQAMPEVFRATARFLSPGEYVYAQFFGTATTSTSMASATGLLDVNARRWDEEIFGLLPVEPAHFPDISDEPARGLRAPWGTRWPELSDIPWYPAVGDGAADSIGCGCTDRRRLTLMVGTSGAMRMIWAADRVEIPDGVWCYRADANRFAMGGALNDGGNLIAWMRSTLQLPDMNEAERQLLAREPGEHGLTLLPLFGGERSPGWVDTATGAVAGLTFATKPMDLMQAAAEAVALRFLLISQIIASSVPGDREIIATGGGLTASAAWRRIMADALAAPIIASGVSEAAGRGAALLALERLGVIDSIEAIPAATGPVTEPDLHRHDRYRQMLDEQTRLYDTLIGSQR